ncbi:uncharacterized protein LOC134809482 [Pan troglodytes]|uniref:uncharacterized protein LOC134809482 n=1 Tax=Pan troglodytes TaxID=9598 RepID=UPI003013E0E5
MVKCRRFECTDAFQRESRMLLRHSCLKSSDKKENANLENTFIRGEWGEKGGEDVTIFYRSTLHSTLNFDLQIFRFRKERGGKGGGEEVQYFEAPTGLRMGTFLAPGALSLGSRHPGWLFGDGEPLVPPGALRYPWTPRPRPPRLTRGVRGGSRSAAFTPAEEAPAAPWSPAPLPLPPARSLARRALSSSYKLSGSAVDKKPGRPSASLPRAGWGELKGTGR